MSALRYQAVILDFDGVLAESMDVKTRAFADLYAEYGPEVQRAVMEYHLANGGVSRYRKFRHWHENLLGIPMTGELERELDRRFSALVEDGVVAAAWVPGARDFLEAFHRRLALFVASGTPQEELRRIVERRGMGSYFRDVRGAPATKGEIIGAIVAEHGYEPARVLMVGDARADWEGAQQAGTAFVGRLSGGANPFPEGTPLVDDLSLLREMVEG